jgi:lambda family phage portal protein
LPIVKPNAVDRLVTYVSPERGLRRQRARTMLAMTGGYTGARGDRRQMREWQTRTGSADADTLMDLPVLRDRSRALEMNAPLAKGAINTTVTNAVGTGLMVQSRLDREVLRGIAANSDEEFDALERAIEREFRVHAGSTDCDVSRTQNFAGLQFLVFRSALESGDCFAVRRFVERPGMRLATGLQIVEADRCANPPGTRDSAEMAGGVKRDVFGAPTAYRFLQCHPGDIYGASNTAADEIAAFAQSGLRQVYHLFWRTRPGLTRGVPYLAPVIESLRQIDQYREAELMAAVVGAMFTVFVKTEQGDGLSGVTTAAGAVPDKEQHLGNGLILDLAYGEDIAVAQPGRPNVAFDDFTQAILRQIGVALELPFEILIKHFTASYSAAQAALVEAWKFFRARRAWLVSMLCQPFYEAVIYEAVARGLIRAPGFLGDPFLRAAYLGTEWVGPPRGQINQLVEVNAARERVDMGVTTLADETAEMTGGDWERKHPQSVKEMTSRVAGGLVAPVVAAPRRPTDPLTAAQPA